MAGPVMTCSMSPSLVSLASLIGAPPSAMPCQPGTMMPPPATVRLASICALAMAGASTSAETAIDENTPRIKNLLTEGVGSATDNYTVATGTPHRHPLDIPLDESSRHGTPRAFRPQAADQPAKGPGLSRRHSHQQGRVGRDLLVAPRDASAELGALYGRRPRRRSRALDAGRATAD